MRTKRFSGLMSEYEYPGDELGIFAHAKNWKQYFRSHLSPYIRGDVIEVGAGLGTSTAALHAGDETRWLCLEPDGELLDQLRSNVSAIPGSDNIDVCPGTLADVDGLFDTVLYIDVLEHIEDDHAEIAAAADHLRPGGLLVVLAPAHAFLYSAFDRAIGHYRRYNARSLRGAVPGSMAEIRVFYLDSLGMLLSLANRALLRRDLPSVSNIMFWDRFVLPCSRVVDPLLLRKVGRSVIGIWEKREAPDT